MTAQGFAAMLGIQSLAAAVIFIFLYAPLVVYFPWRAATKFNYVFIILTSFCLIRIVAFAIRADLAHSTSASSNLGLIIADEILFGIGFTGLLYALVSLQGDRERIADLHYQHPILVIFLTNRRMYHLGIVAAVVLTVIGINKITSSDSNDRDLGNTLRTAGIWVIFALTICQGVRSGMFIFWERSKNQALFLNRPSFIDKQASTLLGLISAILALRMVYSVITIREVQHESSWYPLSALPEFLSVCILATPGLILSRVELQEKDVNLEVYRNKPLLSPTVV